MAECWVGVGEALCDPETGDDGQDIGAGGVTLVDGATGTKVIEVLRLGMLGSDWVDEEGLEKLVLAEEDGVAKGTLVED